MRFDAKLIARVLGVWVLALVGLGFWALSKFETARPPVVPASAPASEFSAERAYATLGRFLGPELPHPASSDENAAVRARVMAEFAKLGVKTETYQGTGCRTSAKFGLLICATVTDIIAEVIPGDGKAIVLLAHYDSVPAGPGAADDGSGVATILETVRALKASGAQGKHPVIALITDGEEFGLLGADSFVSNPKFRERVGIVVNVEARGNQGPSLLFQTSPGSEPLIDLYARAVPAYATSSLFVEIYRALPNDTDVTEFLDESLPSLNFAFSENVAHYHTPLDTRANLSLLSLQHHGENMLGVTRALLETDYDALEGGDAVYLSVLGRFLPRMPVGWVLPLALFCFGLMTLAAFLSRGGTITWGQGWAAIAMPVATLMATGLCGWLLHYIAQLASGMPDPSNAYPDWFRMALGFGVFAALLLAARMARGRAAVFGVWLWYGVFAIITAALLPGLSPYFLFPVMAAAILLLIATRVPGNIEGIWGTVLMGLAAIVPLVIWMGLVAQGETLMGLKLHPLFTIPAAFAALPLVPVLNALDIPRRAWIGSVTVALAGGVGLAVYAGMQPAYSAITPQPLNINYVEDSAAGTAAYAADAVAPLPASVKAAAKFGEVPESAYPFARGLSYIARVGAPKLPAPQFTVAVQPPSDGGRRVDVAFAGSEQLAQMFFVIPDPANVRAFWMNGRRFTPPEQWKGLEQAVVGCESRDCRNTRLTFELNSPKAFTLTMAEIRFGLPDFGKFLAAARPNTATTNRIGDSTILIVKVPVPGS